MNKRLVVPAAVAMALHAILLFGFKTPHGRLIRNPMSRPELDPWPPEPIELFSFAGPAEVHDAPPLDQPEPRTAELQIPLREVITTLTIPHENPGPPLIDASRTPSELFGDPHVTRLGPGEKSGSLVPSFALDHPPHTKSQIAPVYPYEARMAGRAGEVMVEFVVDEAGRVVDPHVVSSTDPAFEGPTLRAVGKWRFEPGRKGGHIVRFRMTVPITFAVNQ